MRLETLLNLRRHELLPASLLFLYLFLGIGSYIMGRSVGDALFLSVFPDRLPHAIIGSSLMIGVFVSIYIRLSHRMRVEWLVSGTLLFFSVSFAVFWWLTRFNGQFVYPLIYVFMAIAGAMTPTMGWTLANYVLTTREARRVFGFIGAGSILGSVFAGLGTAVAVRHVRTETLLLAVAAGLAVCALLVKLLFVAARKRLAGATAAAPTAPRTLWQSWAAVRGARYLLLVTALIAVGSVCTTIIGYQFKVIAKAAYGPDKAGLTSFFATFDGFMGIASFLLQLLVTGRVLRTFGIRYTLFVLPALFLGGSLVVLLFPMLVTVGILRGSHALLRFSLDKASTELLYLPVSPEMKTQVKSFIDTFVWRVAEGVAGAVLLLFAALKFGPGRMSLVNFVFLGTWIAVAVGVRREYLNVLRRAIERRTLDPEHTAAGVLDSTTAEVLAAQLTRGDEQQVLYGLSLFEMAGGSGWHPSIRTLLPHKSAAVRQRVLRVLSDAGDRDVAPQVELMLRDQAPEVRAEALHYLVVHTGRDPIQLLGTESGLPDYALQGSMVAYLARTGKPENFATAHMILQEMMAQSDSDGVPSRVEAARVLGVIPPPSALHAELPSLLRDDDNEVVEQALGSAGKICARELLPLVIANLARPRMAPVARAALVPYGERAIGTLHDYLNDETVPVAIRKHIPAVLARIPLAASATALANSMVQSDPGLRFDVVKALNKIRRRQASLLPPSSEYEDMLMAELIGYYRSFQILAALDRRACVGRRDPAKESVLVRALRERMDHELERVFRLLGLLYPPGDIHNAFVGLTSGRPQLEANSLEVLENLLKPELYRMLAYVLDPDIVLDEKLGFAQRLCRAEVGSKPEALSILLRSEDRWLQACALHEIGDQRLVELSEEVRYLSSAGDRLLDETRRWAGARLEGR